MVLEFIYYIVWLNIVVTLTALSFYGILLKKDVRLVIPLCLGLVAIICLYRMADKFT